MKRAGQLLFVALCVCLAGCAALPGLSTETSGSSTPTGTGAAGTGQTTATTGTGATAPATGTGTGVETPTPRPENLTIEYVLRAGSVPAEFQSVTVEFEVVFAERSSDLDECVGTLLGSRYEPTPTALPSPVGGCHSEVVPSIDLAAVNGTRTLGSFTAPGRFDGAYALVVRDVVPVYGNGTAPTAVYDTDFFAHARQGRGPGRYGVEIGIAVAVADRPWTYAVVRRNFDPGANRTVSTDTATGPATGTASDTGTSTSAGTGTRAGTGANTTGTEAGSNTGTGTRTGTAS